MESRTTHQILSMMGLVIAVARGVLSLRCVSFALDKRRAGVAVPLAPASNLVLAECVFRNGAFEPSTDGQVRGPRTDSGLPLPTTWVAVLNWARFLNHTGLWKSTVKGAGPATMRQRVAGQARRRSSD